VSFTLSRTSGAPLQLTDEHDLLVQPRRGGAVVWSLDGVTLTPVERTRGLDAWVGRATTEMHSLALFTQLASQVHLLGAPLDWSGAFARVIADEVRHTDLSLRMSALLGGPQSVTFDERTFHLPVLGSLRAHVRHTIVEAFCIGETLSGRMYRHAAKAATVPVAKQAVTAILVDETFHAEFGWELGALLMRPYEGFEGERAALAAQLPAMFASFARQSCVTHGPQWTAAQPMVEPGENLGTLTDEGYAQCFYAGMEADVVPGLEAIGLPEAREVWQAFLATHAD
jgi:hypothetical protein